MDNKAEDRIRLITDRIQKAFFVSKLKILDNSHLHRGHIGAAAGGGHFSIQVVSDQFQNKSAIERHKMIYVALGDAMGKEIHAISINAKTPAEAANQVDHNEH